MQDIANISAATHHASRPRTFSILGDSISTFAGCNPEGFDVFYEEPRCEMTGVHTPEQTWWCQLVRHFKGTVLSNGSFSGSMVEGEFFPAAESARRARALAGPAGEAPDAIIVFMGINDYGWGSPQEQAAGGGSATPPELLERATHAPAPDKQPCLAPHNAAQRFEHAYGATLAHLRHLYPSADIWCATLCPGRQVEHASENLSSTPTSKDAHPASTEPKTETATAALNVADENETHSPQKRRPAPPARFVYRVRGVAFDSYNDAIRAAAQRNGCHVADVRAWGMDYESVDGTHPTARGMRQLARMMWLAMEQEDRIREHEHRNDKGIVPFDELPAALRAEWDSPRDWRSRIICNDACATCPHANIEKNRWSLMCAKPQR